jgi:hypothetical protein
MNKIASQIFALVLVALVSVQSVFAFGEVETNAGRVIASDKFAYSLYAVNNTEKFRFAFDNEEGKDVTVKIFDSKGELLFVDKVKGKTELKRDYDLSNYGKGVYLIEVASDNFKAVNKVAVNTRLESKPFVAYLSPAVKDGAIKVAYENSAEGVYINIKDGFGALVYSEINTDMSNFSRKYNLSSLRKGSYTVEIVHGDKVVTQNYFIN